MGKAAEGIECGSGHAIEKTITYCERGFDTGMWAEPINALTNLAFIVAGFWLFSRVNKAKLETGKYLDIILLVGLVIAIGVGSALWHTHATPWSMQMDVIPIQAFIFLFIASFVMRVVKNCICCAGMGIVGFLLLSWYIGANYPPHYLNGSIMYVPAAITLLAMTIYLFVGERSIAREFFLATILLAASIAFRTIDVAACQVNPFGTHFIWHVFNAMVLTLLVNSLITREVAKKAAAKPTRKPAVKKKAPAVKKKAPAKKK